MTTNRRIVLLCLFFVATAHGVCLAQGTSGSQFLGVGMGARAMGMGGAYVSLSDDGTALYWNPGGLAGVNGHQFAISHLSWFGDAAYQFASYARPFGSESAIGLALEQGSLSWDNTGEGDFEAGDFSGAVGYARRVKPNLGIGAGVKYLSSRLGDDSAASYALDVGMVYRLSDSTTLGAAVRNLGPGLTYISESDPLPATLAAGASHHWKDFLFAVDLEKQNDLAPAARVGVEYTPLPYLALRGGFAAGEDSALSPVTGGIGLRWNSRWALDYAYRPSDLGGTQSVALSASFGGGGLSAPAAVGRQDVAEATVPKPNITLLAELTASIADGALDKMGLPEGARVHLRQTDQHEANWLVQSVLVEALTDRGHAILTGNIGSAAGEDEGGSPSYEISYRIVACETAYPRAWREWVVGSRKVERRTTVDIRFQLSDATKTILWAGSGQRDKRDIVPGGRVAELTTPGQAFTAPELQTGGWDRIIEPVVVAGIVGGLIYLFYTSKSAD